MAGNVDGDCLARETRLDAGSNELAAAEVRIAGRGGLALVSRITGLGRPYSPRSSRRLPALAISPQSTGNARNNSSNAALQIVTQWRVSRSALWAAASLTVAIVLAVLAVVVNWRAQKREPSRLDLDDPEQHPRWEA
jgi:hypothetical protein